MGKRGPKAKLLPAALVIRYRRGELNATQVGRLAGLSLPTALRRLREAGADTSRASRAGRRRDPSAEAPRDAAVVGLYRRGLGLAAVGRRFGLTPEGVRYVLIQAGVPRRPRGGRRGVPSDPAAHARTGHRHPDR